MLGRHLTAAERRDARGKGPPSGYDRAVGSARRVIGFVHPAPPRSRSGNRRTAVRWAAVVRALGHRAFVARAWEGRPCDVLVALHAERSHPSVERFRAARPAAPLVVVATGTDVYRDGPLPPAVLASFRLASRIVVLQELACEALPAWARGRARVVHQAVATDVRRAPPSEEAFELVLVAHLRPVKDPLRAAEATRLLSPSSRVRVLHAGGALDPELGRLAAAEAARNPRYVWLGELSPRETLLLVARSRALLSTSLHEGGPHTLSEALALGVPVLASHVPGHLGLLGRDYPGTFPPGDTAALARLVRRVEEEPAFLASLERACAARAPLVAPAREREAWRALLAELLEEEEPGK